jgi:hypothetical protein
VFSRELWVQHNYAKTFDLSWQDVNDTVERISVHDVSCEDFIARLGNLFLFNCCRYLPD